MIKIPACFSCKHYKGTQKYEGVVDQYGETLVKYFCEAYPEGIPQLKMEIDEVECAEGIFFEKGLGILRGEEEL